eukprot:7544024-Pyramimonas_sp.AAC.1
MASGRTRDLRARIRSGASLGPPRRWGISGLALQRVIARRVLGPGADLLVAPPEPLCPLADPEVL